MGSKKHKEKHRKKDKHKHRSRKSRSRSRSKSKSRSRSKSRSPVLNESETDDRRQWRDNDDKNTDRDYQDEVHRELERIRAEQDTEKRKEKFREVVSALSSQSQKDRPVVDIQVREGGQGGGDVSLSITETNKIRAKLGLKPLDVGGTNTESKDESAYENREDVHAPPINIADQKRNEKLREKLAEIREKKRNREKLGKIKKLVDTDDPVMESAADWVARIKLRQKEKEDADRRAKMLSEMDEEFGVSGLADEMFGRPVSKKDKGYTARDLRGIKIEHGEGDFREFETTVLTLQDRGILDEEDEDILENINMVDDRRTRTNIENRKMRPDYKPYDDDVDESGMYRARGVLEKYDQEIDGVHKKSFRLDASGHGDMEDEYEMQRIKANLRAQQFSLETAAPTLATDYYTTDDMVKFNKPKRRRKVRKRQMLKADDLLPLDSLLDEPFGDNQLRKKKLKSILKTSVDRNNDEDDIDNEEDEFHLPRIEDNKPLEDDEAELELQLALQRSRKATLKRKGDINGATPNIAAERILASPTESPDASPKNNFLTESIILDSTSEFCRTLGEIPTVGPLQNAEESGNEEEAAGLGEGWEQVVDTKGEIKTEPKEEDSRVLDDEPTAHGGVASALQLARMKGFLEEEKKKTLKFAALKFPESRGVIDEEKLRDEERIRIQRGGYDRDRDRDRERYDPYAFKEKEGYKPNIQLEYVDEGGRQLNQKEAFRFLSHKFHGKGSGKMKTGKRAKKQADIVKYKQMSAIDTPLNTTKMMKDRQQRSQQPYLVLSGGGKNLLTTNTISKK